MSAAGSALTTRRADWIVGTLIGGVVMLVASLALAVISGAIQDAYGQGYRDGGTGAPYHTPVFGRLK